MNSTRLTGFRAYIALGSNRGTRMGNIHQALDRLSSAGGIKLKNTSRLYETPPMYVETQSPFLNAACEVETDLDPKELLIVLKAIEADMGRFTEADYIRNGPRNIDLDILLYHNLRGASVLLDEEILTVPHPRILEREFVLAPLNDIAPDVQHPLTKKTFAQLLRELQHEQGSAVDSNGIYPILPFLNPATETDEVLWKLGSQTFIMGILNTTPDSFSDGGKYACVNSALTRAESMVREGVDIIDIGGHSTRPGSSQISLEQELDRVCPIVQALRDHPDPTISSIPISVDTYRARVAKEAIGVGASMINDISGGLFDPGMLAVIRDSRVPYVMMHIRASPEIMMDKQFTNYDNGSSTVVSEVRQHLSERVNACLDAGIYRWQLVLDPGIGFSKVCKDNLALIHNVRRACPANLPVLLGASRKAFIGQILAKDKKDSILPPADSDDRLWGSCAAVSAAIPQADIVRVHDVHETFCTIRVVDAIKRRFDD